MAKATIRSVTHKVQPRTPAVEPYGPVTEVAARGSCVLLHGWGLVGPDMWRICEALKKLPSAAKWNFYYATYETHTNTFVQAAQQLRPMIRVLTQPLILLGYSMGSLVGRQMIMDALPIKALVSICGPHEGLAWLPGLDDGTKSMQPDSPDLTKLNGSPKERAHRKFYHWFAISYHDIWGEHSGDTVVYVQSALGLSLGRVAERVKIRLDYDGQPAILGDPHLRGMDPYPSLLRTCSKFYIDLGVSSEKSRRGGARLIVG
jgi:pimeloyl-ACP methyl ester carboxylesterase